jgi:hypothetical protein
VSRAADRRITADEFVRLCEDRSGRKAKRQRDSWLAPCPGPGHDDRHPSLRVREGRKHPVVFSCLAGCHRGEILGALGLTLADLCSSDRETEPSSKRRTEWVQLEYLHICSGGSDGSTGNRSVCRAEPTLSDVVVTCLRFATATTEISVGIDPTANRQAVEEERFSAGDLEVKLPPRAGRNMRHVLEHLVDEANERLAGGWKTKPIACGTIKAGRELGMRPSAVSKALRGLERHGAIERVRRLDRRFGPGREEAGAWTWRLVVVPAIEAKWEINEPELLAEEMVAR